MVATAGTLLSVVLTLMIFSWKGGGVSATVAVPGAHLNPPMQAALKVCKGHARRLDSCLLNRPQSRAVHRDLCAVLP